MNINEHIHGPERTIIGGVIQVEPICKMYFVSLSCTDLLYFFMCPQSVLDEMMVEQTDLVRLRLVRMSNVPDTLYMVNNAVPQCCHMINHQQMACNTSTAPSVVANEIPGIYYKSENFLKSLKKRTQMATCSKTVGDLQ